MNGDQKNNDSKKTEHTSTIPEFATAKAVIRESDPESRQVESIEEQVQHLHTGAEPDTVLPSSSNGRTTDEPPLGSVAPPIPRRQQDARSSREQPNHSSTTAQSSYSAQSPYSAQSSYQERSKNTASSATSSTPASHSHTQPQADRSLSPDRPKSSKSKKKTEETSKKPGSNPPRISARRSVKRPMDSDAVVVGTRGPLASLREMFLKEQTQSVPIAKPEDKIDRLLTMMQVLGIALLQSHQATPDVGSILKRIAAAYNMPPVRVVTLPTVLVIQVEGTDRRAEIGAVEGDSLRLDQTDAIELVVEKATRGVIEPDDAIAQVERAISSPPRFNWFMRLIGQIIMTLAIGLLINPALPAIPAYLILGLIVGLLILVGERFTTLSIALPVISAAIVTVVSVEFLVGLTNEVPIRLIAPALVTFLPGLTLTLAALELTRNEVIAGSSRLIYGLSQLMLLAFGVVIGMAISPEAATTNEVVLNSIGPWTPLLGIALLALGYVLARSAPQSSYLWLVLALSLTYLAQRLGMLIVPNEFSGFFGALIVVPLSRFLVRFKTAPSAVVTQLVSFWILVPGALGFVGFAEAATGSAQTINTLVSVVMALFSIALGMIVGSGLIRDTGQLIRAIR